MDDDAVPKLRPAVRRKKKYNDIFSATRVLIENAFGILKKRFLQLIRIDLWEVEKISKFIVACCVVHNLCIDCDDECSDDENEEEGGNVDVIAAPTPDDIAPRARSLRHLGELKRNEICQRFTLT